MVNSPCVPTPLKNSCCLPTIPHCSAHCSSWIIFPFLLQILNHCCQTVLSLKDMYSLLPGSCVWTPAVIGGHQFGVLSSSLRVLHLLFFLLHIFSNYVTSTFCLCYWVALCESVFCSILLHFEWWVNINWQIWGSIKFIISTQFSFLFLHLHCTISFPKLPSFHQSFWNAKNLLCMLLLWRSVQQ